MSDKKDAFCVPDQKDLFADGLQRVGGCFGTSKHMMRIFIFPPGEDDETPAILKEPEGIVFLNLTGQISIRFLRALKGR